MNSTELVIMISLHILAALLPAIGIGHAVYRKYGPVRDRATYTKLTGNFKTAKAAAEADGDAEAAAHLERRYCNRLDRREKISKPSGDSGCSGLQTPRYMSVKPT